jgi:hypothetical protein
VKWTPDELRDVYARGTSEGSGAHPEADVLARLLQDQVSAEERERVVGHIARCSRCAEEVRVARPVRDALANIGGSVPRPALWWRPVLVLAAAASVLVVAGLAVRLRRSADPASEPYRSAEAPGVQSLIPSGASLRRDAFVLRWTGAPSGATFEVIVANERLDVVARLTGLHAAEATVPAGSLAAVPAGSKLVWQVTTVHPDGSRSASRSFLVTLE